MKRPKPESKIEVRFVSPGERVPEPPLPEDQKRFPQSGMALERWGEALFGYERRAYFDANTGEKVATPKSAAGAAKLEMRITREFYKARDRSDMKFWKDLYVRTFEVLRASIFRSVGAVDKSHRKAIEDELDRALDRLKTAKGKDAIHEQVIASLFRLVFLLLGRPAYAAPGKLRNFSTFRTLTYSQTEDQLSWLLQSHIHGHPKDHGFDDTFAADFAFHTWVKDHKKKSDDRSAYVEWVRDTFPDTYALFH